MRLASADVLRAQLTQWEYTGGFHTAPDARGLILFLVGLLRARVVVETGFDAGYTTEALAAVPSVERVIAIDSGEEYPQIKRRLQALALPKVELVHADALLWLRNAPDRSVDFIFIDDNHDAEHVRDECIEVQRVLSAGGVAAFHDTVSYNLWSVLTDVFADWSKMNLPALNPFGVDMGLGLVRKG